MTDKQRYTDDELTAWLNGEFKAASSRELERSMSLDNDLKDRVASLATDISAVQSTPESEAVADHQPNTTRRRRITMIVILALAVALLGFLFV